MSAELLIKSRDLFGAKSLSLDTNETVASAEEIVSKDEIKQMQNLAKEVIGEQKKEDGLNGT